MECLRFDHFFKVWSFIKSFHYYKKQLLKKRLSKTSSSSVMKQEQCDSNWRRQMTNLYCISRTVFCILKVFTKVCHIRRNTNFTGWQRDGYQDDHHDLRVTKIPSTLWLVHRDPHGGLLKIYTKWGWQHCLNLSTAKF